MKSSGWRPVQEFVYLDNWRIVRLVDYAGGGGSSLMAVLSDPMTGTPRQVMDSSGDIRWDWDSKEAFGNQAPDQAPTSGKSALVFDARFPGQWYDSASGLFHNNWRDYWARAGRYTQVDPIGLAGGANPYAYAGGNPVEAIDPLGLKIVYLDSKSEMAVEFLRANSKTAALEIAKAEKSWFTLKIRSSRTLTPKYHPLFRVIDWNPDLFVCNTSTGNIVGTPELQLYHEIAHFNQSPLSPKWAFFTGFMAVNDIISGENNIQLYTNSKERHIISPDYEHSVSSELGIRETRNQHVFGNKYEFRYRNKR